MDHDTILKELRVLGLDHEEAVIYVILLSSGYLSVLEVSAKSNLERTLCYRVLQRLQVKKLVKKELIGKKVKFFAEKPTVLHELLEHDKEVLLKKEQRLYQDLPDLITIYNKSRERKPSIKTYYGLLGTIEAFKTLVNELKEAKDTMLSLYAYDHVYKFYDFVKQYCSSFLSLRKKQQITCRILSPITETPLRKDTHFVEQHLDHLRPLAVSTKQTVPFYQLIAPTMMIELMLKDYEFYALVHEDFTVLSIENSLFDLLWNKEKQK